MSRRRPRRNSTGQIHPLAVLRCAAGLLQQEVADALGVQISAVQRWESGDFIPTARRWPKYAKVLHITVKELTAAIVDTNATNQVAE